MALHFRDGLFNFAAGAGLRRKQAVGKRCIFGLMDCHPRSVDVESFAGHFVHSILLRR
jgi:hypothetical protein